MLYGGQRPPSMHSQHHPHQFSTFPPVETDLDEPPSARHMVDAATLLTAPNEIMYASAGAERLGTTPPMSTEEEEEEDDEEAAALYSGAHLMTDDERFALAASEDDYMHMGGESGGGDGRHRQVGIYGWRKKVTYLLLSVIVLLVVVNAVLTYWIISFLGLSSVRAHLSIPFTKIPNTLALISEWHCRLGSLPRGSDGVQGERHL